MKAIVLQIQNFAVFWLLHILLLYALIVLQVLFPAVMVRMKNRDGKATVESSYTPLPTVLLQQRIRMREGVTMAMV